MAYFKIGNTDFSEMVGGLQVSYKKNYNSKTNAAGNTVIDYMNTKRTITVNIVPSQAASVASLLTALNASQTLTITFQNPLEAGANTTATCFIAGQAIPYYTLSSRGNIVKGFTLTFQEL